jgi:hypothetical protein
MCRLLSFVLLATGLVLCGCRSRSANATKFLTIPDATKEQFLTITRLGEHGAPATVQLQILSKIENSASLVLLLGDQPQHTIELASGAIETEWHGDWPSNQMKLHYLPHEVKSGALQIAYLFSDR